MSAGGDGDGDGHDQDRDKDRDRRAQLDEWIGLWLERVFDEAVVPREELERLLAEAPEGLREELRRELEELLEVAQSTIQQVRLQDGARVGDFVLGQQLGSGSTGVVWAARRAADDPAEPPRYALKILHPVYLSTAAGQRRVRQEIEAARQVEGPGLVPIVEVVEEGSVLALAFPLIGSGSTLADELAQARDGAPGYDRQRMLRSLVPALEGLAHLHARGIAHLDLKPANLLRSSRESLVLTDLGLAKALDEPTWTRSQQLIGTPAYMSPELARGARKDAGPAADVWAFGVTLYEVLHLRRPFEGASTAELLREIEEEPPPLPTALQLPPPLGTRAWRVILRCLEKDPERRYPDAGALLADLQRLLASQQPVGVSRGREWRLRLERRRREVVVVGLALLVAATTSLVALRFRDLEAETAEQLRRTTRTVEALDRVLALTREASLGGESPTALEDLEDLVELAEQPSSGSSSVRASILSQLAQLTWSGTLSAAPGVPLDLVGRAVEVFGESDDRGLPLVLVQQSLMLERSGARRSATEALLAAGELFAAEPRAPEPPSVAAFRRARSAWCRARARRLGLGCGLPESEPDADLRVDLQTAWQELADAGSAGWAGRVELELLLLTDAPSPPALEGLHARLASELGEDHSWTLEVLEQLARVRLARSPEATNPAEELRARVEAAHGAPHPWVASVRTLVARTRLAEGDAAGAQVAAAEALDALGDLENEALEPARLRARAAWFEARLAAGLELGAEERARLLEGCRSTLGERDETTLRVEALR